MDYVTRGLLVEGNNYYVKGNYSEPPLFKDEIRVT